MNGEALFNQEMFEVIQEVSRQLLVNGGSPFNYRTPSRSHIALIATSQEHIKILGILHDNGVIKLNHYLAHTPFSIGETDQKTIEAMMMDVYEVATTREKLDKYAETLDVSDNSSQSEPEQKIICTLRLDDLDLKMKIGNYEERQVGRLHQDRSLYKLMIALSNRPTGTDVNRTDVLPNMKVPNLWQIFVRSNYGYLKPFFKYSKDRISFQSNVELSKLTVVSIISKINEKYRNNFVDIVKDFQR